LAIQTEETETSLNFFQLRTTLPKKFKLKMKYAKIPNFEILGCACAHPAQIFFPVKVDTQMMGDIRVKIPGLVSCHRPQNGLNANTD
jgi:hypothetical protein